MEQQWTGIGWVTNKPHYYRYGKANCALFTLACNRPYRTYHGNQECDFIQIIAWRDLAIPSYCDLEEGRLIKVDGWIKIYNFKKAGVSQSKFEVVATDILYLDNPPLDDHDLYDSTDHQTNPLEWK